MAYAKPARTVFRPGETVTVKGALVDAETGQPIANMPVNLEVYDPATGTWKPLARTRTGGDGSYSFTQTLPSEDGSWRWRTRSEGTVEFAADVSPSITITVKKPKAARTTLSFTLG
jgi:uncharacterized protein YfaS (alpha-2-macroglobulin family)